MGGTPPSLLPAPRPRPPRPRPLKATPPSLPATPTGATPHGPFLLRAVLAILDTASRCWRRGDRWLQPPCAPPAGPPGSPPAAGPALPFQASAAACGSSWPTRRLSSASGPQTCSTRRPWSRPCLGLRTTCWSRHPGMHTFRYRLIHDPGPFPRPLHWKMQLHERPWVLCGFPEQEGGRR